ncbi:MAG: adenosylcobinamide-phosphate synthase CbiB [Clostridiales bacterium]|nr:adenosylcobinamide-phosphate synthase CbiB [Clostridiales bacterium]
MPDRILALLLGFLLDLLLGDPPMTFHPVRLIGRYIAFAEAWLRRRGGNLRRSSVVLTASSVALAAGGAWLIVFVAGCFGRIPCLAVMAVLFWLGIAVKDLAGEAHGVRRALADGVEAGRKQVARIVGRDTGALTEEEIVKATVETVAENAGDGVVSPMFWAALGGPVLLWGFKAVSTLDSMVGYRDERYMDIGWSGARLDDVMNYVPARLTAFLLCAAAALTGLDAKNAVRIVRRDHANHASPNSGWPEAAAAGALGIRLGGTHTYFGKMVEKPTLGDDVRPAVPEDINRVVHLLYITAFLAAGLIAAAGFLD